MRWTTLFVGFLAASITWAAEPTDPKTLDIPAEKTKEAAALIAKLDDDDVAVRDKASEQIKAMGREALPALLTAMKAKPSNESQIRIEKLLPAARKADLDARYPLFLADKDRKFDHDLPGWTELKAAVKDTKESRLLFADIMADESCRDMLLLALDPTEAKKFEKRWEEKLKEWRAARPLGPHQPKADDPVHWMLAGVLADLLYGRDYHSNYRHHIVLMYTTTDEGKKALTDKGRYGGVMRGVAKYWIEKQTEPIGMAEARNIAVYMEFDEGYRIRNVEKQFEQSLKDGSAHPPLTELAVTKDAKFIANFRRLFESSAVFLPARDGRNGDGKLAEIQLRDAALAMCIALAGDDPTKYGFSANASADAKSDLRYNPYNYFFDGDEKGADEKRTTAFKKWAEWEKANPDKIKAKPPEKKDK